MSESGHAATASAARRLPLLVGAMLVMLLAMWGGLLRLGWTWPAGATTAVPNHGPLMVGGFLGTLIGLERAVALRRWWVYLAPVASVLGSAALLVGLPPTIGQLLLLTASIILLEAFFIIVMDHPALFTVAMAVAVACWVAGNVVWSLGQPIPTAVSCWVAFLVLTIVGERLELSRLLPRTPARAPTFLLAAGIYITGVILSLLLPGLGWIISGLGLLAMAAWLVVYDLARRTIRQQGLTRFVAVCLLTGYAWLAAAGALMVWYALVVPLSIGAGLAFLQSAPSAGPAYDAVLHAVLLGFVFAMIFGHAPIIFPAVLAVPMEYRPRFYSHLALLQASVLARVLCDLAGWWNARSFSGLANAAAILLFVLNTLTSVRIRRTPAPPPPSPARVGGTKPISLSINVPPARRD